jgi:hypothetical protein
MPGIRAASSRRPRRDTVIPNGDRLRRRWKEISDERRIAQDDFVFGIGFTLRTFQRALAGERITKISLEQIARALSIPYKEAVLTGPPKTAFRPNTRNHLINGVEANVPGCGPVGQTIQAANELRLEFRRAIEYRHPPLTIDDFAGARQLIDAIRNLDLNNGHVHYYAGEIKRWTGMRERSRDDFFLYLDYYKDIFLPDHPEAISLEECYENAHGYCGERTAWIHHLLALDLGAEGRSKKDAALLEHALNHANAALEYFSSGFVQFEPTASIRDSLETEITKQRGFFQF